MQIRPYQVMFDGCMSNMTEENWLTIVEKKTAKLQNKDEEIDKKDNINLQAHLEQSNLDEPIENATLSGYYI